jgi:hypothetical protein
VTTQTPGGRYGAYPALWTQPLYTFTCGACASSVTALSSLSEVESVMRLHYELCPSRAAQSSGANRKDVDVR